MRISPGVETILDAFVAGDNRELNLLKFQLSEMKRSYLKNPDAAWSIWWWTEYLFPAIRLEVYSNEDCALGDRRLMIANDVVGVLGDGSLVFFELHVLRGFLFKLRMAGMARNVNKPIYRPLFLNIGSIDVRSVLYKRSDIQGSKNLLQKLRDENSLRIFSPPDNFENPSEFQRWVLSLDSIQRSPAPNCELPFSIRRAQPISNVDVAIVEKEHRCKLPLELIELWEISNGMSFFGREIYSSNETSRIHIEDRNQRAIIISGEDDLVDAIQVHVFKSVPLQYGNVYRIESDSHRLVKEWKSLRSYLEYILKN